MPDKVACALSAAIEALVLGSPTLHDAARAEAEDWDDLAITNMVQVLIRRGYEVISPEGEHLALPYSSPVGASPAPGVHSSNVPSSPMSPSFTASAPASRFSRPSVVPAGPAAGPAGAGGGAGTGGAALRIDTTSKDSFQILIEVIRHHQASEESASAENVEADLLKLLPDVYITEGVPRFRSLLGKARNTGYRDIWWQDGPTGRPDRIRVGIKGFVNYNNYDRSSSAPYASSYVDYAGAEDTEPSSPANESPSWRSSSAPATSTSARRFATLLQAIEEARRLSASESDGYGSASASGGREGVEASKVGEALRRMDAQLLERETCNLKQYVIKAAQSGIRVKWTNGAGSGGRIHTY